MAWLCGALAARPAAVSVTSSGPLASSLRGQAATDYQAARILFDDGDYAGASLKFQHAFEESGDARLLWNIAVCEKNLRH
jgi:TolA-binding protein